MLRATRNRKLSKPTKKRARRPPPPSDGLSIRELAARAGVTPRAVRYYVVRGALAAPEFRGPGTRYTNDHLLRIFAIQALQRDGLELDAIRRRLAAMTPVELERFAPAAPAPAAVTGGLVAVGEPTYLSERWERVPLLPGLELAVRADASPAVRRLVQEMFDHCVGARAPA